MSNRWELVDKGVATETKQWLSQKTNVGSWHKISPEIAASNSSPLSTNKATG